MDLGGAHERQSIFGLCMEHLQSAMVQQMAAPSMCVQVALIGLGEFYIIYEKRSGYQVKRGMCWGVGEVQ